jgi:hypothetical protein
MAASDYDNGNNEKADDSDMGSVMTAMCSGKRQVHLPTDHIKRLLEEAYPNHMYPIKHELKDGDMMRNFMASGSLTRGRELEENPGRSDAMPFSGEDAVVTVYDGRPESVSRSPCGFWRIDDQQLDI